MFAKQASKIKNKKKIKKQLSLIIFCQAELLRFSKSSASHAGWFLYNGPKTNTKLKQAA